ncbi:MAG: energy transducer TonB, partial [Sandarakinorhabdus sp.]|nr:energy transducer TonB [Sandarakinorhabdus sp.]
EYPPAALALGQSGSVGYRLLVDAQGQVESCDIVESSGHAALDKGTCDLVARRARFVPARGVDGAPMAWSYRGRIKWMLRTP